jgi:hypothetical protein
MKKEDFMKAINSTVNLTDSQSNKSENALVIPSQRNIETTDTPNTEITTTQPQLPKSDITSKVQAKMDDHENRINDLEFSLSDDARCPGCGVTFDFTVSFKEKGYNGLSPNYFNDQFCFRCPCCGKELDQVTLKTSDTTITANEYSAYLKQHTDDSEAD